MSAEPDPAIADGRATLRLALSSMRNELPDSAVIATDADAMVFLYTNRLTIPLTILEDTDSVESLCPAGVTHVALVRGAGRPPWFVDARDRGALQRMFDLTDGPSLYGLTCS